MPFPILTMPFNNFSTSAAAYLIQRYFGRFIDEKLTKEQLKLNFSLSNGLTATATKIGLDVQAINELDESQLLPVEVADGYVEKLSISAPYNITSKPFIIEIEGLRLVFRPKQHIDCATSVIESMYNSMSSSIKLAEDFAKQESSNKEEYVLEGLETIANVFESILSKVKIFIRDVKIEFEYVPLDSLTGIGILIEIALVTYIDESSKDNEENQDRESLSEEEKEDSEYLKQAFTVKNISFDGVKISTLEFASKTRVGTDFPVSSTSTAEKSDHFFYAFDEAKTNVRESEAKEARDFEDDVTIMFGKLNSTQEIRICTKQVDNVAGPKFSIEFGLGELLLFLSPRQVHLLIELFSGLCSNTSEDLNLTGPTENVSKPMGPEEHKQLEQLLHEDMKNNCGLKGHGWSVDAQDQSSGDVFYPMGSAMHDSLLTTCFSSMDASFSSSVTSMTERPKNYRKDSNFDIDPTAEITHFEIRVSCIVAVVLHEDLITPSAENPLILIPSSVEQMQRVAEDFFLKIFDSAITASTYEDFAALQKNFESVCKRSHLRLFASPVHMDAREKTTSSLFSFAGQLSIMQLELIECLYKNDDDSFQNIPILNFNKSSSNRTGSPFRTSSAFKVELKYVMRNSTSARVHGVLSSRLDISMFLDKCFVELDFSIIDRLSSLIYVRPVCIIEESSKRWTTPGCIHFNDEVKRFQTDVNVSCPHLIINLRIPIPDFRPAHDLNKVPWWRRNIRPDFFILKLRNFLCTTSLKTDVLFDEYDLKANNLEAYYCETENSTPLLFAKSGVAGRDQSNTEDDDVEFEFEEESTRVIVKIFPEIQCDHEDLAMPDPMTQSTYGYPKIDLKEPTGPFSSTKVMYESDVLHQGVPEDDDREELIIPGTPEEVDQFVSDTSASSRVDIELYFPILSIQLLSKHKYELIYNRINNDLLLWTPCAPKPKAQVYESVRKCALEFEKMNFNPEEKFAPFTSCLHYYSESSSDDESDEINFQSAYDPFKFSSMEPKKEEQTKAEKKQSQLTVKLLIDRGLVAINAPCRDSNLQVLPQMQGELILQVDQASLFLVNGYMGDRNLGFVYVSVHNADLYHADMVVSPCKEPKMKLVGSDIPTYLKSTIHKSERGVLADANKRGRNREMLTIAVRINENHETHHVKSVRMAFGLNMATLKHRVWKESNSWISHIMDFFNVQDYPINGYQAKEVLTELYLHLWDCAIDYRPYFLPYRALVTLGHFSLSSHLTAQAHTSTLRFIFQDCNLFISNKNPPENGEPSTAPVNLVRDYINVVELGIFELSHRTTDKKSTLNPHFDMRLSVNMLHIRTCADSARALSQLINYFATDGDLSPSDKQSESGSNYSSPRHSADQELISMEPQDNRGVTESEQQRLTTLLKDAMKETVVDGEKSAETSSEKLFLFPDEAQLFEDSGKLLPQVTSELGDPSHHRNVSSSDTDDEFCIIGNVGGVGKYPKDSTPEVRWLTKESVHIHDDHFSQPQAKIDHLKTPKDYPTPVSRYTLHEMTLVWHMYGGSDFGDDKDQKQDKNVEFSDVRLKDGVSYSSSQKEKVSFTSVKNDEDTEKMNWKVRGGRNRNHSVLMQLQLNKVKFSHEKYPETSPYSSRQVLLISDLEIRDRLKVSDYNKFLYLYTSTQRPRQSNAHMVLLKLIHIRPDMKIKSEECILKLSLLPLKLNIDQDSLLFLIDFFTELNGDSSKEGDETKVASMHGTPTHQEPIFTVCDDDENSDKTKEEAQKMVDDNLLILLEESKIIMESDNAPSDCDSDRNSSSTGNTPIYFRKVIFSPDVPIRLDYTGKRRIDMKHGSVTGLLMGLGHLQCPEVRLKRITYDRGVLGFDKLMSVLLQEWLKDIKKYQLHTLLGGVGPFPALIQLFQGIRDLFWLPIEQYQKDGRIVRGLQRGANSFTKSTTMAALELTSRIIYLIQVTAETAYDMLSPGPSSRITKVKGKKKKYHHPQDIREGVNNAISLVKEGINQTADTIVQVASQQHEQKGYSGAVGGVIREIPSSMMTGVIVASAATRNVIGGLQSQLVPDSRNEANQKWRCDDG